MIEIKKMEGEQETRGKALVAWRCWQEVYRGLIDQDYLDKLTLQKCEEIAFRWPDNLLVAKDDDQVIGFVGYGIREEEPEVGEIFALYVLPEYHGKGVGRMLMEAGLEKLKEYPRVNLWVLKENSRARRFYEKCGFVPDGSEKYNENISAWEIRMTLNRKEDK